MIEVIALSALLFVLQGYLCICLIKNSYHFYIMLLTIVFLTFVFDTGFDFSSHGGYNRIILFIFMFLFSIITIILHYIIFNTWLKRITILSILIIITFSSYIKFKSIAKNSCNDWYDGLSNSRMDNSKELSSCKINSPDVCYFNIFDGLSSLELSILELERPSYQSLQEFFAIDLNFI